MSVKLDPPTCLFSLTSYLNTLIKRVEMMSVCAGLQAAPGAPCVTPWEESERSCQTSAREGLIQPFPSTLAAVFPGAKKTIML